MYSLYRAWFGEASTVENGPRRLQESFAPPDTVVRVGNGGEYEFVAHKGVLAAHSGYLKALLANAAAATTANGNPNLNPSSTLPITTASLAATNAVEQSPRQPVTSVSVSSIGGEAFAPLLNYMYTGRLEVTLDNVYSVLLATHLLHMPGALEQCRAALLRLQGPPHLPAPMPMTVPTSTTTSIPTSMPSSSNILRPIPNRLIVGPTMCWPPPAPLYPPIASAPGSVDIPHLPQLQPSVLIESTVPSSVSAISTPSLHKPPNSSQYSGIKVASPKTSPSQEQRSRISRMDCARRSRTPESGSSAALPLAAAAAAAFSAFAASSAATSTRVPSPSPSSSPTTSSSSRSPIYLNRSNKLIVSEQLRNKEGRRGRGEPAHRRSSSASAEESTSQNRENDGEVVSTIEDERGRSRSRRKSRIASNSGNGENNVLSVIYDVACCDGPVRFERVLNENYTSASLSGSNPIIPPYSKLAKATLTIEGASSESDENGGAVVTPGTCQPIESTSGSSTGSYICQYCQHTFKSQYCYKKHAKRHLLPAAVSDARENRRRSEARNRKEVKLRDLNVQYYPCKICGCKFPSYYFVHKHRKLCHGNVDERSQTRSTTTSGSQEQKSIASTINDAQ